MAVATETGGLRERALAAWRESAERQRLEEQRAQQERMRARESNLLCALASILGVDEGYELEWRDNGIGEGYPYARVAGLLFEAEEGYGDHGSEPWLYLIDDSDPDRWTRQRVGSLAALGLALARREDV